MDRKKFLGITAGTIIVAGTTYYLLSDTGNLVRADITPESNTKTRLKPDEKEILFLASLAPSGHNAQPWFVKYLEPYHWVIGNDKSRWLPGVDPHQRETILSIGAFIQNLEYAAANLGYNCQFTILAANNQAEDIMNIKLVRNEYAAKYDSQKIKLRRTLRSDYSNATLQTEDLNYLLNGETDVFNYIPNNTKNYHLINEKTIEANKLQSYRDAAEAELGNWVRFSSKEAEQHRDGLTTAGMDITGISAWVVRNFYDKPNVMQKAFREQNISNVITQVSHSAGWMLITSKDNSLQTLIETGKQMQRLFLKVRDKGIAMHPMSQVLEEPATDNAINATLGIHDEIQFMLRIGYVKTYPDPVSLRRPVGWFVRQA